MISPTKLGTYVEFLEQRGIDDLAMLSDEDVAAARHLTALHQARLDSIIDTVKREKRTDLLADEQRDFERSRNQAQLFATLAEMSTRGQRVAAVRASTAPAGRVEGGGPGGWRQTGGGRTYNELDRSVSWLRDMTDVALNRDNGQARDRLQANNREAAVELRALSATDGAGGDFVPPLWIVDQFIAATRPARPTADRVMNEPMPAGTDTINLPKLLTGTAVAEQATQNTVIQNTDATTGVVTGAVAALAGGQTISVQLLEQTPAGVNIDKILLQDRLADYSTKVDLFVLNNNAVNKKGLLQLAGTTSQVYTDAAPTTAKLFQQVAQAIASVQTTRYQPPDTIVTHPRPWAAFQSAADTTGRPLMVTAANGPYNAMGEVGPPTSGGPAGRLQGLDVITDPQIPTNLGAGTNQDVVIVMRASDQVLYEGAPRAEAFRETKPDSLAIYLRVYNYVAFLSRYPTGIAIVSGTGLTPPAYGA